MTTTQKSKGDVVGLESCGFCSSQRDEHVLSLLGSCYTSRNTDCEEFDFLDTMMQVVFSRSQTRGRHNCGRASGAAWIEEECFFLRHVTKREETHVCASVVFLSLCGFFLSVMEVVRMHLLRPSAGGRVFAEMVQAHLL